MANEWTSDFPRRDDSAAKYVVRGDELIKLVPIIGLPNVCDTEVVMTADAFRECYKKWIVDKEREE